MSTTTNGRIPEFLKYALTIKDMVHDAIIDANIAEGITKGVLKNASKPLEAFVEAVDGKSWDQITGKMLGTAVDFAVVNKLFAISKAESFFPNTFSAKISEGFSVLGLDAIDISASDYFEKAFPAATEFWEKLISDKEYANRVWEGLKKVADLKQFKDYYENATMEKFLSDLKELLTPLDTKDFVASGHSLGGATLNILLYDPIALDLNNNGKIDTLSLENGVFFDHNGDDIAFKSSWISGVDGILVRDIDGDGKITSGAELFGNFTRLKNGELAKNGAEALKDLDDNNDGIIYSNDKAFNEILIWQDKNSDGISQKNELKTLREHNIKSIDLEFLDDNKALDKDNKQILIGSFTKILSMKAKVI